MPASLTRQSSVTSKLGLFTADKEGHLPGPEFLLTKDACLCTALEKWPAELRPAALHVPSLWMMLRRCKYSKPMPPSIAMLSRRRQVSCDAAAGCSCAAARQSDRLPRLQYSAWQAEGTGQVWVLLRGVLLWTCRRIPGPVHSAPTLVGPHTCDEGGRQGHQPHKLDHTAGSKPVSAQVSRLNTVSRQDCTGFAGNGTHACAPPAAHLGWCMRLMTAASACSSRITRSGSCSSPRVTSSEGVVKQLCARSEN